MKKIRICLILAGFLILIGNVSFAQQDPMFAQYKFNMMSINPAYAGSEECISITAINRSQWIGIKGAPQTQTLSVHTPFKNNYGLGLSLIRDQVGPVNYYAMQANSAYIFNIKDKSKLALGLMLGFSNVNIRLLNVEGIQPDDFVFQQNLNAFNPIVGFGVFYYAPSYYVGFSSPDLIENSYEDNTISWKKNRHMFFSAGYSKNIDIITIEPSLMLRYVMNAPISIEVSTKAILNDFMGFGLLYRFNDAIGALFSININENLILGYSYDYSINMLRGNHYGSHEIMLNYSFCIEEKSYASPRYF